MHHQNNACKKQLSIAEEIAKLKLKKIETKKNFGLNAQKESNSSGEGRIPHLQEEIVSLHN